VNNGDSVYYDSINADLNPQNSAMNSGLSGRTGQTFAILITDPTTQVSGNSAHPIEGIAIVTLKSVDNHGNVTFSISPSQTIPPGTGGVNGTPSPGSLNLGNAVKIALVP
jgi:hypothetical protein